MEELFKLFYKTTGVCTDTRSIKENSLFIALKGDNFNGNAFALQAIEAGAKFAIVDQKEYATHPSIFLVDNSLHFLQKLANHHRKNFKIPVIGITGSNGKTSTKELLNAVLSTQKNVLATKGNLNNHIGVPLTLLNLNSAHEIAIIEMGANRFKDIEELCDIAEPTHGIITNIGKAHLEGFGNFEGVLTTKKELYTSVSNNNGIIVYNGDDDTLSQHIPSDTQSISYGTTESNYIQGKLIELNPYVVFQYTCNEYNSPLLQTNLVGKYNFYNFLAAVTFGRLFQISFDQINKGVCNYIPENNRSQVKKTSKNTLILDCYNANPTSMLSALESFDLIDTDRKLVILGDMLELGTESTKEHQTILNKLNDLNLNGYTVGKQFNNLESNHLMGQFETKTDLLNYLKTHPLENFTILLKGSRGIGLEDLEQIL